MAEQPRIVERREPDPTVITREVINREIAHLQEKLDDSLALGLTNLDTRLTGLAASCADRSDRTDTLLEERDRRYGERFAAQQIAVDAAFAAREQAVTAAFIASEKAVEAAFVASEKAIDAAFVAAKEAVTKAEVSIEKRADTTYVTLTDLQRQLTNLMPRTEAEQRISAATEAIRRVEAIGSGVLSRDEYTARHSALQETISSLASRMDKQEGFSGGAQVDRSLQAIRNQVESNTMALTSGAGQKEGSNEQRNLMFAFGGFLLTLLTIAGVVVALWPNSPGG